jgi:hypothetical protein
MKNTQRKFMGIFPFAVLAMFFSTGAQAAGLAEWLTGFQDDLTAIKDLAILFFFIVGIILVGMGFFKLKEYRDNPQANPDSQTTSLFYFGIGGGLMAVTAIAGVMQVTLKDGTDDNGELQLPLMGTSAYNNSIHQTLPSNFVSEPPKTIKSTA